MVVVYVVLALILFGLNLFLTIRHNSSQPRWPVNFVSALIGGVVLLDLFWIKSGDIVFAMFFLAAYKLSNAISTPILEKQAGKLVLTYNRVGCMSAATIVFTIFIGLMLGGIIFTDWPVYGEINFLKEVALKIVALILAVAFLPDSFRKGKIFENGFTTPALQHFPWSAHKRYRWVEHFLPEDKKSYYLALENGINPAFEIHGLLEQDKNTIDELLSTRLERIPPTHS
ncbi:MAG: hypothetical protein HY867_16500 [Chloroflexi bacterium]|nr:hypothetical protein [Chloroflexota bacterium]